MKIAIHENKKIFSHTTLWTQEWIEYCKVNEIEYIIVDAFSNDIFSKVQDCDIFVWHVANYSLQDMLFAKSILYSLMNKKIKVFPNYELIWHFDDKIAEMYLLQSVDAKIPKSYVFYEKDSAINFFENECTYPIVAKLRCGSGSNNVVKINNRKQGRSYVKRMFSKGIKSSPSVIFKAKSNLKSSRDWETVVSRIKRIPDFLVTLKNAKKFSREKGYVYLQEFIPNDGYDLKVVVVGEKLTFLARDVRKNDFRASGGGAINYSKSYISDDIIKKSFEVTKKLKFDCMGFDYVVDKRDGSAKIIEISYGFSHVAQLKLGGYYDENCDWHEGQINAPQEVIKNMINSIS